MNITIMWMKEWVELYTFYKIRVSTLTVKRTSSRIQNPLQIFSSVAILPQEKGYKGRRGNNPIHGDDTNK